MGQFEEEIYFIWQAFGIREIPGFRTKLFRKRRENLKRYYPLDVTLSEKCQKLEIQEPPRHPGPEIQTSRGTPRQAENTVFDHFLAKLSHIQGTGL